MEKVFAYEVDDKGKVKGRYYFKSEIEQLGFKKFKFKCKKCHFKQEYWANKKIRSFHICPVCTGKSGAPYVYTKNIPTWRLNIEYATPAEIFTKSWDEFGVPYMSEEKWKAFYDQPHEKKRRKEIEEAKLKAAEEAIEESLKSTKEE